MAVMPELKFEVESKDSLDGDIIIVRHRGFLTPESTEAMRHQMDHIIETRPEWSDKTVLIMSEDIDLEVTDLETLKRMRDQLNEIICEHERKRNP